jgi:hypothetical protein
MGQCHGSLLVAIEDAAPQAIMSCSRNNDRLGIHTDAAEHQRTKRRPAADFG